MKTSYTFYSHVTTQGKLKPNPDLYFKVQKD